MKFSLITLLTVFSIALFGQNCSTYFPFEKGKTWEMSSYNKKDKLEGKAAYTVSDVKEEDGGTTASMSIKMTDDKGKNEQEMSYDMTCKGEEVLVSMTMFLPAEQLEQMESMESMEVTMDMEDMHFPNELSVGQELKDCSMTMEVKSNGIKVMGTSTKIKDRKVLEKVTVTTEAGEFECYKITQTTEVSAGFVNREYKSVSYISEGVGVVKTESYDKKGNLESYSVLSKL